jgi:hypothetical protein
VFSAASVAGGLQHEDCLRPTEEAEDCHMMIMVVTVMMIISFPVVMLSKSSKR